MDQTANIFSQTNYQKFLLPFAANELVNPLALADVDKLFDLLRRVDSCLSTRPRPSRSIIPCELKTALLTLMDHSDIHVRVAVVSCILHITVIDAADTPSYDTEQMMKVYRLIAGFVCTYERNSRSSHMRRSILESVSEVQTCFEDVSGKNDSIICKMLRDFLFYEKDDQSELVYGVDTIMKLVSTQRENVLELRRQLFQAGNLQDLAPSTSFRDSVTDPSSSQTMLECIFPNADEANTTDERRELVQAGNLNGSGLQYLAPSTSFHDSVTDPSSSQTMLECIFPNADEANTTDERREPVQAGNLNGSGLQHLAPSTSLLMITNGDSVTDPSSSQTTERRSDSSNNTGSVDGWELVKNKKVAHRGDTSKNRRKEAREAEPKKTPCLQYRYTCHAYAILERLEEEKEMQEGLEGENALEEMQEGLEGENALEEMQEGLEGENALEEMEEGLEGENALEEMQEGLEGENALKIAAAIKRVLPYLMVGFLVLILIVDEFVGEPLMTFYGNL